MLPSTFDKTKLFAENFSKNSNFDDLGIYLPVFASRTNLKLYTLTRLILADINFGDINFRVDLFSRMSKTKFFARIYFRGWVNFSNFAWINFHGRQNFHLKKLFFILNLNKQKKLKDLDMKVLLSQKVT